MRIDLPAETEARLRKLAATQGRELSLIVEEAIRQYLEAIAITDVDPDSIADTQSALLHELRPVSPWQTPGDAAQ